MTPFEGHERDNSRALPGWGKWLEYVEAGGVEDGMGWGTRLKEFRYSVDLFEDQEMTDSLQKEMKRRRLRSVICNSQ